MFRCVTFTWYFQQFRRHVTDNALHDRQREPVQSCIIAERVTAGVQVFDRDGAASPRDLPCRGDPTGLFQKLLDAVGHTGVIGLVHSGVFRQDVLPVFAGLPLFIKLRQICL